MGAVSSSNASNKIKGMYFNSAKQEFEKIFANTPDDTRYHLFYGSFLAKLGQASSSTEMTSEGINHLLKAEELSPRKQSVKFEIGNSYINGNQFKLASKVFKDAFELFPSYDDARFNYAVSLVLERDIVGADKILEPLKGTKYLGDTRLIRAYYQSKQMDRLKQAMLYKISYAKIIAKNGNKKLALAEVESAVAMMPSLKTEGDRVIAEINAMK